MRGCGVLGCIYSGGCPRIGNKAWEVGDFGEGIHAAVTVPRALGGWC